MNGKEELIGLHYDFWANGSRWVTDFEIGPDKIPEPELLHNELYQKEAAENHRDTVAFWKYDPKNKIEKVVINIDKLNVDEREQLSSSSDSEPANLPFCIIVAHEMFHSALNIFRISHVKKTRILLKCLKLSEELLAREALCHLPWLIIPRSKNASDIISIWLKASIKNGGHKISSIYPTKVNEEKWDGGFFDSEAKRSKHIVLDMHRSISIAVEEQIANLYSCIFLRDDKNLGPKELSLYKFSRVIFPKKILEIYNKE